MSEWKYNDVVWLKPEQRKVRFCHLLPVKEGEKPSAKIMWLEGPRTPTSRVIQYAEASLDELENLTSDHVKGV